jgi:putative transposase
MDEPHRKRCKRYDVPGDAHFLTFSCFRRLPLFTRDRSRQWMLDAIALGRKKGEYDLWAYVIMPEHVHLVILPHVGVKISTILTTLKQSVSKRALLWLRQNAPQYLPRLEDRQPNGMRAYRFWQRGGGYDRNLRTVADIYQKIEYVHNNPVRRKLVEMAEEWLWSSCRAWQTGTDIPIAIDRDSLPPLLPPDQRW